LAAAQATLSAVQLMVQGPNPHCKVALLQTALLLEQLKSQVNPEEQSPLPPL